MSFTQKENIKSCHRNDKAYLYALVELQEDSPYWGAIDHSDDKEYYLNNVISYIGETSNPYERYSQHKCPSKGEKGKKIGMVVFNRTSSHLPHAEIKAMESEAIFKYALAKGTPPWQKGAKTFSGA
jgi:predicted GIY-YIG superfamily endonuclease